MPAPQVDFYVLAGSAAADRLRFACRLVEKAWLKRHRVRVQLDSGGDLDAFDQLLWTYSDRSFIPHRRAGAPDDAPGSAPPPVVIADTPDADAADGDVLVNLASAPPSTIGAWARIAEIVDADPERKRSARERYKQYRERGCTLESHNL